METAPRIETSRSGNLWRRAGGGVDRGPRFAHHYLLRLGGGVALEQVADQPVGLPRGGAVADADELDLVLLAQLAQGLEALINLAFWFERIDGGVIDQLAGGIHHGHLDPGADARISPMVQRIPPGPPSADP